MDSDSVDTADEAVEDSVVETVEASVKAVELVELVVSEDVAVVSVSPSGSHFAEQRTDLSSLHFRTPQGSDRGDHQGQEGDQGQAGLTPNKV